MKHHGDLHENRLYVILATNLLVVSGVKYPAPPPQPSLCTVENKIIDKAPDLKIAIYEQQVSCFGSRIDMISINISLH